MERFYKGTLEQDRQESLRAREGKEWLIGKFDKFVDSPRGTDRLEFKYWKVTSATKHETKVQRTAGELTIVRKGRIEGCVDNKKVTISEGEYIYISPETENNLVVRASDDAEGYTIKAPSDPEDCIKIVNGKRKGMFLVLAIGFLAWLLLKE